MEANELRIGNITDKGTIVSFYERGIHVGFGKTFEFNEVQPIPLTEEWLLKFGLKKTHYNNQIIYDSGHQNSTYIIIDENSSSYFMWGAYLTSIKYVHELQNLYFALIKKELEIKQ